MLVNTDKLQSNLNTVNSRLQATMNKREKLYDTARFEFERRKRSFVRTNKVTDDVWYYSDTLENFLSIAEHADGQKIQILKTNLKQVVFEVSNTIQEPARSYLLRQADSVADVLNNPKAAKVKESFKSAKRALREDLLGSVFGDTVGGMVGRYFDSRKERKDDLKNFKRGEFSDRRSRMANILDNVKLDKVSPTTPTATPAASPKIKGFPGTPGPDGVPNNYDNQLSAITPGTLPFPGPPPIVGPQLGPNQKLSKSGKFIMTQGEDQKWTKEKNPNYVVPNKKAAVSNANANGMQTSAQTQENREEDLELFKKEIELLEKIELNTRGMSDSLEKKGKGKDDKTTGMFGQFGDFLKAVPALTKEVLGLGKVIAPFLPQILLAAGALKVGFDAYQLASDEKTVAKSKAIGTGTGTGGDPKKNDVIDTLLTGAGSALGNMNPITAYKRMTGEMTAEQAKQQQIDLGTGLQAYLNDGLKMLGIDESQKVHDDPIMQRNYDKLAKEQDRKAELKKKGIVDEKVFDVMPTPDLGSNNEMPKIALPKVAMKEERVGIGDLTKDIKIPSIPKMMFEMPKTGSEQVNPKTAMEKVATLLPTGTKAAFDKALIALNPMREIKERIQRMVGLSTEQKDNISRIMEGFQNKGYNEKQMLAILGVIQKESQFKVRRENDYTNTKDLDYIRRVFKSIDSKGNDIPGGRLTKAKYDNTQLDSLRKDPTKFGEAVYGKDTGVGKSMGNTEYGDGWKYRGRGLIQITGKNNYSEASKAIFQDDRLVRNPDLALDPKVAGQIAIWFIERGSKWISKKVDPKTASQEDINRFYTSVINGSNIDTSDPTSHHSKMFREVNANTSNPQLVEAVTTTGNKLAQGSKIMAQAPPPPAPVIIDNSKTSVSGGGGGGSSPSAGIPNVRNEESSFRRQTDKTSRF